MQNNLGLLDFSHGFSQFVRVLGVLVPFELYGDRLHGLLVVVFELSPLVPKLLEEEVQHLIEEGEDHSFGVALVDEGVGGDGFIGHLDVANLVVVHHAVPGVPGDAGEGLPDYELERVFGLVPEQVADVRHLIVPVDDTDLLLIVLNGDHASEYHHL